MRSSEKAKEEGMEHLSFLIMVDNFTAIMFKDLNFVPSKTVASTCMKEPSVFITLDGSMDFVSLFPEDQLLINGSSKCLDNGSMEKDFSLSKCTDLLNGVKKINNQLAVNLTL